MIYATPTLGQEEEAALDQIQELRRSIRFYVAEPRRWMSPVRRVLAARAIQGSNSIEGYDVSVEDAVAAIQGNEPSEAAVENWKAVTSYRRAHAYVLQLSQDQHFTYTPTLLKSLHFMMTEYALDAGPGLWRREAIWVRNNESGEVVYEGPEADRVPALMDDLIAQLTDDSDTMPSVRGAMAHLNLVMVHPFRHGNGRMARCLQTLVLAREGTLAPEFSSIEELLGTNATRYYEMLARVGQGRWNPSHDTRPWVRFCLEAHFIQAASVLRRIRESERMWDEINALIARHGLPDRTVAALFDATLGLRVRNSSYRASVAGWDDDEVSSQVATKDLGLIVKSGLVAKSGKKRGTYYEAAEPLLAVRERIRSDRKPISAESVFRPTTAPLRLFT